MTITCLFDYAEPNLTDVGLTIRDAAGVVLIARQVVPATGNNGTRYSAEVDVGEANIIVEDWDAEAGQVTQQNYRVLGFPVAPDNAGIAAIGAKTDNLPDNPASVDDVSVTVDGGFTADDRTLLAETHDSSGTTLGKLQEVAPGAEPVVVIPSDLAPDETVCYITMRDAANNLVANEQLTVQLLTGIPSGNSLLDVQYPRSDADGLLSFTALQSAQYQARRRQGEWVQFTTGTDDTFQLPAILGKVSGVLKK